MKRGLLLIDRGSREPEAKAELEEICARLRESSNYDHVSYCFLEVIPPYIDEGVAKALANNLDVLTVVPYFLYPGKKLKAAVGDTMQKQQGTDTKIIVSRPMRMHATLVDLVNNRIHSALKDGKMQDMDDSDVDVLIIGHGSVDPNARRSLDYVIERIRPRYRNAAYCFLEIEQPDIPSGIKLCDSQSPRVLVIMFYFLHEGAHVKRDIYEDLNPALESSGIKTPLITRHLGADSKMIDLIIERAAEAETGAD